MEPYFDNIDDEAEYLARRVRRKKRMIERKRRKRRQFIIKCGACLSVFLIVLVACVGVFGGKAKTDKAEEQMAENQSIITEVSDENTQPTPIESEVESEPVEEVQVYEFESTSDTKNIYSDNVISSHAILIDESTDTIVASKGAKDRINPASMTKVLTVLVAAEHITEEQLDDTNHYCTIYDMAVIMKAAIQNELCLEVLSEKCYTTASSSEHPEGLTISNWFLRRIEDKETGGEVVGAKTGYVVESGSCAVSYSVADDGTPYICATAGSTSSWRCIYDHVEIYTNYVPDGNA